MLKAAKPFRIFASTLAVLAVAGVRAYAAAPRPIAADHGMVVTAHHLASKVGLDVLKSGGNAIDAAVAVGYALAVTYPAAGNLGGGGFMLIRFHDGHSTFLDFREMAPMAARADMFLDGQGNVVPNLSTRGYLATGIPGSVAGLDYARTHYGTKTRAAVLAPAIALARDGFILDDGDSDLLAEASEDLAKDAPSRAIFMKGDRTLVAGERLVQKDLAASLSAIAKFGPDGFYRGPIAAKIVAASKAHGGIMTMADFASYRVREFQPLTCGYRGYQIASAPPPSSGGIVLCESLNILSGYDVATSGFHSADNVHVYIEALRRAFHDRNTQLGDPDFVKIDLAHLLDPAYAASLRSGIGATATRSSDLPAPGLGKEGQNTTHFSIVDQAGNAVAMTYTLNDWFGARVVPEGTGILLNDEMDDFSAKTGAANMYDLVEGPANAVQPGKRPLSSMTPTIITRDERLVMVVGTPGGSRIPTSVLQVISNLVDHGFQLQEAVNAPRLHHQWLPDVTYVEHDALSPETRKILEQRGHRFEDQGFEGQIAAILVGAPRVGASPKGAHRLYGALDPRLPTGAVMGY